VSATISCQKRLKQPSHGGISSGNIFDDSHMALELGTARHQCVDGLDANHAVTMPKASHHGINVIAILKAYLSEHSQDG